MLIVRLPETGEEFVDNKLTDIELNLISGQYVVSTHMYVIGGFFLLIILVLEYADQKAVLSWYPPPGKFENSGRNVGRWMKTEETKFLVRKHRNAVVELDSNSKEIERRPQRTTQWKHGSRGSSDIHRALLRINSEARAVIKNR